MFHLHICLLHRINENTVRIDIWKLYKVFQFEGLAVQSPKSKFKCFQSFKYENQTQVVSRTVQALLLLVFGWLISVPFHWFKDKVNHTLYTWRYPTICVHWFSISHYDKFNLSAHTLHQQIVFTVNRRDVRTILRRMEDKKLQVNKLFQNSNLFTKR